jgi:hypothetical protein
MYQGKYGGSGLSSPAPQLFANVSALGPIFQLLDQYFSSWTNISALGQGIKFHEPFDQGLELVQRYLIGTV